MVIPHNAEKKSSPTDFPGTVLNLSLKILAYVVLATGKLKRTRSSDSGGGRKREKQNLSSDLLICYYPYLVSGEKHGSEDATKECLLLPASPSLQFSNFFGFQLEELR